METDANKEVEMSEEELAAATGGAKNSYNPVFQEVKGAFDKSLKDAKAAQRELLRSSGGTLGSTNQF